MLGLNLNWGTELLDDLVGSLLTSVSLSNLTALLGERWDPTAHQMPCPSLPGWATKQQNKHANTETFPQWFSWPPWLLPQRLRVTRKSVTNKDDFTCSCWVGSTHQLAAEHPSGTAKNTLKKYIASVGKTESTGRSTCVCGLSTAAHGLLKQFPWCTCQSATTWACLAGKEGKGSKIQQGSICGT